VSRACALGLQGWYARRLHAMDGDVLFGGASESTVADGFTQPSANQAATHGMEPTGTPELLRPTAGAP